MFAHNSQGTKPPHTFGIHFKSRSIKTCLKWRQAIIKQAGGKKSLAIKKLQHIYQSE